MPRTVVNTTRMMLDPLRNTFVKDAYSWAGARAADEPDAQYHCPSRDILAARLDRCRNDATHAGMPEQQSCLLHAIIGELGNNIFDHNIGAWRDVAGVSWNAA